MYLTQFTLAIDRLTQKPIKSLNTVLHLQGEPREVDVCSAEVGGLPGPGKRAERASTEGKTHLRRLTLYCRAVLLV